MDLIKSKKCTGENGCGKYYPATSEYFHASNNHPDKLRYTCKKCVCIYAAKKYLDNRSEILLQSKKYYRENGPKMARKSAMYYSENKPKLLQDMQKRNLEDRKLCLDEYGHKCVWDGCGIDTSEFLAFDHINNDGAKSVGSGNPFTHWLIKNNFPKTIQLLFHNHNWLKELNRIRASLSPDKRHIAMRKYNANLKLQVLTHYSPEQILHCSCLGCYIDDIDLLTLDHEGGRGVGAKHRKEIKIKSGTGIYLWLKNNAFPKGFRTLCWNCNKSGGAYGYCPHEQSRPISEI